MLIDNKRIAIVGGGPGGLTLARLLQMNGANVKVYERDLDKNARVQGATLDLHTDSGLLALEKAGLMEAFKANYRPGADKIRITDEKARIVYDQHTGDQPEDEFGSIFFRPEIDRGPLRKILLDSLQEDTVVWNSRFLSMEKQEGHWRLHFQDGSVATADIVIAADGANSGIRPYITSIKPFYTGITALEGNIYEAEKNVPGIFKLLKGGKIFAFGGDKTLIVSSKGDGSIAFYTGCHAAEGWAKTGGIDFTNNKAVLNWFKERFTEWDESWHALFENEKTSFIPRPLYCMPVDQTWKALPDLTMLGDAAHLMPPYAGEGVNMAMLDAVMLAGCLLGNAYNDVQSAIADYENRMRIKAAEAATMSLDNTAWMHADNALRRMMEMFGL